MTNLAITGASGFIGGGLIMLLPQEGISVIGISRQRTPAWVGVQKWVTVQNYTDFPALCDALEGAECVLHLADDPNRGASRDANRALEIADTLIAAMKRTGVRRAIIASSVYARAQPHRSRDSYGAVKRQLEERFLSVPTVGPVILRLPPVYGPGGRGGVATLVKLLKNGFPLPFGLARSPRSYLSRRNLTSLVSCMLKASDARWSTSVGKRFEPSDGMPVGTRELVRMMASQLSRPARLIPVPIALLRLIGALTGQGEMLRGAVDALEVADPAELHYAFGWLPIEQMPQSLTFLRDELGHS